MSGALRGRRDPGVPPPAGSREDPLTVSRLNQAADQTVRDTFGSVWVVGEVGRFTAHGSGHWYFTLKDDQTSVAAVMFRSRNHLLGFRPEEGMSVLALAIAGVYVPRGQFQLVLETLEPRGRGSVQVAFEQLRKRLAAEGLFGTDRKKHLPLLPDRIGVVTSPTGAALRDVLQVGRRRHPGIPVLLYPARVQGEGAAAEVAAGIEALDRRNLDLILVVRGGGAYEDLAAFNDEHLARVIAAADTPVLTGIGHEMDVTIADLVADLRTPTPSAAAERAVPARDDLLAHQAALHRRLASAVRVRLAREALVLQTARTSLRRVPDRLGTIHQHRDETDRRIRRSMETTLVRSAMRLASVLRRLTPAHHRRRIAARRQTHSALADRLPRAIHRRLEHAGKALATLSGRLDALSPLAVLNRGYALVTLGGPEGPVITDAARVAPGDRLTVRLSRGSLDARVKTVQPGIPQENTDGKT